MIVIFLTKKQGGVQLVQLSNCPTFSDQIAEDEWCDYLRHIIIFYDAESTDKTFNLNQSLDLPKIMVSLALTCNVFRPKS